jgi:hypothetical protein
MKKTTFLLAMTIFMVIATTLLIISAFYVMPVSRINFILITAISSTGYLGAFYCYDTYLQIKKS